MKSSYYLFDAGINYRDNQLGMNELEDAKNVFWESALRTRNGYELRNATLSASSIYASSDVLSIVDYLHYEWGTAEKIFLFVSIDSGGGSTADKIVVFQHDGVPSTASAAFTVLDSTAYAISYTEGGPFDATQLKNKVYMVNGEDDPYVLYEDTTWKVAEVPVCDTQNDGSTEGAQIIANGSSDDWAGAKIIESFEHFLYMSDGKTMYFAIADKDEDPSKDVITGGSALITGVQGSWDTEWYQTLDSQADITRAVPYNDYLFLIGSKAFYQWYSKDFDNYNYNLQRVTEKGVHGDLLVTPGYVFWVSDDGIWGFDGAYVVNLSKKIWGHIKTQNTTRPSDFDDCTLAYYDGKIWISFPNGTDKEVYVFDPDLIYTDDRGDTHAPFYRFLYYTGASPTAQGFEKFKVINARLFAKSSKSLYELDVNKFDNNSDTNKVPISWYAQSAYLDQQDPTVKKTYQKALIETAANIDTTVALTATFYRDHGEASAATSTLDTTYSGNQRSYIELAIPYTIDGNTISVKVDGAATGKSGTAQCILYGFSIDYIPKTVSKTEVD